MKKLIVALGGAVLLMIFGWPPVSSRSLVSVPPNVQTKLGKYVSPA